LHLQTKLILSTVETDRKAKKKTGTKKKIKTSPVMSTVCCRSTMNILAKSSNGPRQIRSSSGRSLSDSVWVSAITFRHSISIRHAAATLVLKQQIMGQIFETSRKIFGRLLFQKKYADFWNFFRKCLWKNLGKYIGKQITLSYTQKAV